MASQLEIVNLALVLVGEKEITQTQLDNESTKPALLCANWWAYCRDEVLEAFPWDFAKRHWPLEYSPYFGIYQPSSDIQTITGISQADPAAVTITSHKFETGHYGKIYDVVGMTEVNERVFKLTDTDANTVSLDGIDSQHYTAYVSGGKMIRMEPVYDYQNGYTYNVPSDCLLPLKMPCSCCNNQDGHSFEVLGTANSKRILTTLKDAVLVGTAAITTTTEFSDRYIRALAARLAAQIVPSLAKKDMKLETFFELYRFHLQEGGLSDARQGKTVAKKHEPWIKSAGLEQ